MAILKQESAAELCREIGAHKANELHFSPNSNLHFTLLYFSTASLANENFLSDLKLKVNSLILPKLDVDEIRIGSKQVSLIIKKNEQLKKIHSFLSSETPFFADIFNRDFSEWLPHIIISDKIIKKGEVEKSAKPENIPHQMIKTAIEFERISITKKENDRFYSIYDRKLLHDTCKEPKNGSARK